MIASTTERVDLRELAVRYVGARPRLSTAYEKQLARVARGIEKACRRTVYADELCQSLIDTWAAAELTRIKQTTLDRRLLAARALWGEAWRLGLTDAKPENATHWIDEDGLRYIARGNLSGNSPVYSNGRQVVRGRDASDGSLRKLFRDYYVPRKLRSSSVHGVRLHEIALNNFERFLGRTAMLADLDDDIVSGFLAWMRALPRAAETVNNNRSRLTALWNFAARKRFVEQFPDVEPDIAPRRIPKGWTMEELGRLFSACASTPGWIEGIRAADWWLLVHYLLLDTGERIRAVLSARFDWFDPAARVLTVPAEARKCGLEDRRYPLNAQTIALLEKVRRPERLVILEWPWSQGALYYKYAKILKRAGLPTGRKAKFHCMRKSVASHGARAGMDAQALMGHSSSKVTAAYLDPAIVGQAPGGSTLPRPLIGGEA